MLSIATTSTLVPLLRGSLSTDLARQSMPSIITRPESWASTSTHTMPCLPIMALAFVATFSPFLKNRRFSTGRIAVRAMNDTMAKAINCISKLVSKSAATAPPNAPNERQMIAKPDVNSSVIKSVDDINIGDNVRLILPDGEAELEVSDVKRQKGI